MRFHPYAIIGFTLLALLDAFVWFEIWTSLPGEGQRVYFMDAGQGDAQLLIFPSGIKVLIDAGPGRQTLRELEAILPAADRYIDLAILTHAEQDHFGGFEEIISHYQIGAFLWNGREPDTEKPFWNRLKALIEERHTPFLAVRAGDRIRLRNSELAILSPTPGFWASAALNDGSLVARAAWPGFRGLFTADTGFAQERALLGAGIQAEVLKVGHHGSKYSSAPEFLAAVSPRIAVIGVGEGNHHGHPAPETLDRLQQAGTKIFRTDQNGTVEVRWEEGKLRVFAQSAPQD